MPQRADTLTTGDRLFAGHCAGGDLLDATGSFSSIARGPFAVALTGARAAAAATHDEQQRAPKSEDVPTFHCPLWPECGCPGGAMRPECPGLKSRKLKDRLWFWARMPVAAVKAFIWFLGLGRLL